MAELSFASVSKRFAAEEVLRDVSLTIDSGELVTLLGPSGCGKTTLLRLAAGFESVTAGRISIDGETVSTQDLTVAPERRRLGMVFQAYALWPHMSVEENVAYPLRVQKRNRAERTRRVAAALEQVGMSAFAQRLPAQLSGGQRQRVALARCLVMEARVVLLDEPLANLDVHLRDSLQQAFRQVHLDTGTTMVYVTHDQAEAMALADRICVLDGGVTQQIATPQQLYTEPATRMVAEFVGRGMVVPAEVTQTDGSGHCAVSVLGATTRARCGASRTPGPSALCLRSEHLAMAQRTGQTIPAEVLDTIYQGASTTVLLRPDADRTIALRAQVTGPVPARGERVGVSITDGWILPGA